MNVTGPVEEVRWCGGDGAGAGVCDAYRCRRKFVGLISVLCGRFKKKLKVRAFWHRFRGSATVRAPPIRALKELLDPTSVLTS